jgi:hypothetical protein
MNRAEADRYAVPGIDRSEAQCEVDQIRFGEMLAGLIVDGVGNMGLRDQRHRLGRGLVGVQPWGHRRIPFGFLCHCAATGAVGFAEPQSLTRARVSAFLSHRTFHKQYHERDPKRQHGQHPKAVEVGKRRCLLLA